MEIDYYTLKANVTTILTTVLIPLLASYGVSEGMANAVVGVLAYCIFIFIALYGERYVSTFLTKEPDGVDEEVGSDFETA